jgi:hypothetical protein
VVTVDDEIGIADLVDVDRRYLLPAQQGCVQPRPALPQVPVYGQERGVEVTGSERIGGADDPVDRDFPLTAVGRPLALDGLEDRLERRQLLCAAP